MCFSPVKHPYSYIKRKVLNRRKEMKQTKCSSICVFLLLSRGKILSRLNESSEDDEKKKKTFYNSMNRKKKIELMY
jgi:hypothetical protein